MAPVELNDELYEQVKKFIETKPIDYPSIKNFVDKAVREYLTKETKNKKD